MIREFDGREVERLGGPSPRKLRDWRDRGFLDGWGEMRGNQYFLNYQEVLGLACVGVLIESGQEIGCALAGVKMAGGLMLACLLEGTPHDNAFLAHRREVDHVVFVFRDDDGRFQGRCWQGETFLKDARRDFGSVIVIGPRALVDKLDERLRGALVAAYGRAAA
jgi:hypothetical protein